MERTQLGDIAKDTVTGYEGVVVCISTWIHGCRRITLQAQKLTADGKPIDPHTCDEPQIEILKTRKFLTTSTTGGPRPEPTQKPQLR